MERAMRAMCHELDAQAAHKRADPSVSWEPMERWRAMARHLHRPRGFKDEAHMRELRRGAPTQLSLELTLMRFYGRHAGACAPTEGVSRRPVMLPPLDLPSHRTTDAQGHMQLDNPVGRTVAKQAKRGEKKATEPDSPCGVTDLQLERAPSIEELPASFIARSCRLRRATVLLAIALETRPPAEELIRQGVLPKSPTALLHRPRRQQQQQRHAKRPREESVGAAGGGCRACAGDHTVSLQAANRSPQSDPPHGSSESAARPNHARTAPAAAAGPPHKRHNTYLRARRSWSPTRLRRLDTSGDYDAAAPARAGGASGQRWYDSAARCSVRSADVQQPPRPYYWQHTRPGGISPTGATLEAMESGLLSTTRLAPKVHPI